jgi:hypothetical protein
MPAGLALTVPEPLPVLLAVSLKPIWQSPCEHTPSAGQSEFLVHWSRPGDPPHARQKTVRTLAQTAIGRFMGLPPCETNLALKVGHSKTRAAARQEAPRTTGVRAAATNGRMLGGSIRQPDVRPPTLARWRLALDRAAGTGCAEKTVELHV